MNKELGQEPAFGFEYSTFQGTPPTQTRTFHHPMGMSKRFYAAIHLKVPDSGEEWLDDMIRKANRRDAACAAMQGLLANKLMIENHKLGSMEWIAKRAFMQADELLKQE